MGNSVFICATVFSSDRCPPGGAGIPIGFHPVTTSGAYAGCFWVFPEVAAG